ncbi:hypothetical protein P691DRAFT_801381 [Macrolepiota fuliginosa MF-IS2]|uniref:Secreted protein n=1 Tax=Macrolepiota fuliginosa MF-IS2 TaxID=1400762 RepID=A0A9P6BWH0_9AGAR|nr:hypothetical protein P691DRAFT_801381 [Macrolepiota fuliginosa MF-IS2]
MMVVVVVVWWWYSGPDDYAQWDSRVPIGMDSLWLLFPLMHRLHCSFIRFVAFDFRILDCDLLVGIVSKSRARALDRIGLVQGEHSVVLCGKPHR